MRPLAREPSSTPRTYTATHRPQCTGVAASFSAIGVPPGAQTCGTASPPPSGSNLLSNPDFELGDTLWSATSNVIDQWGAYEPTRSGTWNAWLLSLIHISEPTR